MGNVHDDCTVTFERRTSVDQEYAEMLTPDKPSGSSMGPNDHRLPMLVLNFFILSNHHRNLSMK